MSHAAGGMRHDGTMGSYYKFPPLIEEVLDNGLRVIWLADQEQPVITVALQLPAGRYCDPPGAEGMAELAVAVMQKGSRGCAGEPFAETLEQAGASVGAETGDEHVILSVRMLAEIAPKIVPLFWNMVCEPAFDERELKRVRTEMLTALKAEYADPGTLANRHFCAELCGSGHVGGRFHTANSVRGLTTHSVRQFYDWHVGPRGGTLVVAGDMGAEEMRERWCPLFSAWRKERGRDRVLASSLPPLERTRIRIVDKPDISQTTLMIGRGSVGETHPDRNALMIANFVLGGGNFSSRLMRKVRSETGRTYGIGSSVSSSSRFGLFIISTSTQNAYLGGVLDSIRDVQAELVRGGITEEELEKAKQYVIGNMAFELEGVGNVAEKLLWLRFYDRANDYIEEYPRIVSSIDREAVTGAIERHLSSEHFVVAAVGRRSEIEGPLGRLGDVRVCSFRADPSSV